MRKPRRLRQALEHPEEMDKGGTAEITIEKINHILIKKGTNVETNFPQVCSSLPCRDIWIVNVGCIISGETSDSLMRSLYLKSVTNNWHRY